MKWRTSDLPIEFSPGPFTAAFNGGKGAAPITFFPGWMILDKNGIAVVCVSRGVDATKIAELLNERKPDGKV